MVEAQQPTRGQFVNKETRLKEKIFQSQKTQRHLSDIVKEAGSTTPPVAKDKKFCKGMSEKILMEDFSGSGLRGC